MPFFHSIWRGNRKFHEKFHENRSKIDREIGEKHAIKVECDGEHIIIMYIYLSYRELNIEQVQKIVILSLHKHDK